MQLSPVKLRSLSFPMKHKHRFQQGRGFVSLDETVLGITGTALYRHSERRELHFIHKRQARMAAVPVLVVTQPFSRLPTAKRKDSLMASSFVCADLLALPSSPSLERISSSRCSSAFGTHGGQLSLPASTFSIKPSCGSTAAARDTIGTATGFFQSAASSGPGHHGRQATYHKVE